MKEWKSGGMEEASPDPPFFHSSILPFRPRRSTEVHGMSTRAVFLDRDGVVVDDPGYLSDPAALRLLPGVGEAIAALRAAGWRVVLVTNQSGVARGYFSEARLAEIHARLGELLARAGAALDAVYYCPHHPEAEVVAYRRACDCRKPAPGLLQAAARDLGLDLAECWMIGDRAADVAAGRAAGCRTILVAPPEGRERSPQRSFLDASTVRPPPTQRGDDAMLVAGEEGSVPEEERCGERSLLRSPAGPTPESHPDARAASLPQAAARILGATAGKKEPRGTGSRSQTPAQSRRDGRE